MTLLELLDVLGQATWHSLWVPVLVWTVLALPLWYILKQTEHLHPHAEYRLSQVLFAALPLGIIATASGLKLLPESAASPLPATSVGVVPPVEATGTAAPSTPSWQWTQAVGLATVGAAAVGLVGLGRLILDAVATARVRASVENDNVPSVQALAARLASRLGVRRSVQVRPSSEAVVPVTLGGLRPTILLPRGLTDRRDALRMTLLHELVHIRRYDDLAQLAERLVSALLAVHPLVRVLQRHIASARERACDVAVLGNGHTSPAAYARLLAAFAEGNPRPDRLSALSLSESPSSLSDRLSAMQSTISTVLASRWPLVLAVLTTGIGLTLGVAACSEGVTPSSEPTSDAGPQPAATSDTTYMIVEEQPKLIGGRQALQKSIEYPDAAKKAGIEGRVSVRFVVDKEGNVQDPQVLTGANKLLDQEALRVIKQQTFEPGRHENGEPARVQMSLPVVFELDDGSDAAESKPSAPATTTHDGSTVYTVVEEPPKLVGGRAALQESIEYPTFAEKAGIEGRVTVRFVADEQGNVQNPEILTGVHKLLNEEAIRAVKQQTFEPGRQEGEPVRVQMSLPVVFELPEQDSDANDRSGETGTITMPDEGTIEVAQPPEAESNNLPPYRPPGLRIQGGQEALYEKLEYPELARKAGIEGRVEVSFTIDEAGQVQNPRITQGVHETLNAMALEAIKQVSFEPPETIGGRTTAEMTLPIVFEMPDASSPSASTDEKDRSSARLNRNTPQSDSGGLIFEKGGIHVVRVLMNEEGGLLLDDERVDASNLTGAVHQHISEAGARVVFLYADGAPTDRVAAAEAILRGLDIQKIYVRRVA